MATHIFTSGLPHRANAWDSGVIPKQGDTCQFPDFAKVVLTRAWGKGITIEVGRDVMFITINVGSSVQLCVEYDLTVLEHSPVDVRLTDIAFIMWWLTNKAVHSLIGNIDSNGTGGGNWSVGSSWSGGVAPTVGDSAVILSGDTISLDGLSNDCSTFQIDSGGTFDPKSSAYVLDVDTSVYTGSTATITSQTTADWWLRINDNCNIELDGNSARAFGTFIINGAYTATISSASGAADFRVYDALTIGNNGTLDIDMGDAYFLWQGGSSSLVIGTGGTIVSSGIFRMYSTGSRTFNPVAASFSISNLYWQTNSTITWTMQQNLVNTGNVYALGDGSGDKSTLDFATYSTYVQCNILRVGFGSAVGGISFGSSTSHTCSTLLADSGSSPYNSLDMGSCKLTVSSNIDLDNWIVSDTWTPGTSEIELDSSGTHTISTFNTEGETMDFHILRIRGNTEKISGDYIHIHDAAAAAFHLENNATFTATGDFVYLYDRAITNSTFLSGTTYSGNIEITSNSATTRTLTAAGEFTGGTVSFRNGNGTSTGNGLIQLGADFNTGATTPSNIHTYGYDATYGITLDFNDFDANMLDLHIDDTTSGSTVLSGTGILDIDGKLEIEAGAAVYTNEGALIRFNGSSQTIQPNGNTLGDATTS